MYKRQVYTLVKTLYDKHDDLVAAHMAAKDMKIEDGMKGMIIPCLLYTSRCV